MRKKYVIVVVFGAGLTLGNVVIQAIHVVADPSDTDKNLSASYWVATDTGSHLRPIPETIVQVVAFPRPPPEKPSKTQELPREPSKLQPFTGLSDTGDTTDTGWRPLK